MRKLTVLSLIDVLKKLPKDAYVFVASDSEQNEVSPLMDISVGELGKKIEFDDGKFSFIAGDDFHGVDLTLDKGRKYVILNPSL